MIVIILQIMFMLFLWPILTFLVYKYGPEKGTETSDNFFFSTFFGFIFSVVLSMLWFVILPGALLLGIGYLLSKKYLPILNKKFDQVVTILKEKQNE